MAAEGIHPAVAEKIKLKTQISFESWRYEPQGTLVVNDDIEIATYGVISYANPFYELGTVIKIKDWHFTIERKNNIGRRVFPDTNDPSLYVFTAFYKDYHCNFGIPFEDKPTLISHFVNLTLSTFAPILVPDISRPFSDASKEVKIELKPNSSPPLLAPSPPPPRSGKTYISIPFS